MKDTGGPAFPTVLNEHGGESDGMTLRDWFAAKAMRELMGAAMPLAKIAEEAYQMADAMLKERNKPGRAQYLGVVISKAEGEREQA